MREKRPVPSSDEASARMKAVGVRDTKPEIAIRSLLHRAGLRYRVDCRPEASIPRTADIVIRRLKIAIFVDGCFWHSCPIHGTMPAANRDYWQEKLQANQERDADTTKRLGDLGWTVLRYWEHEEPSVVAEQIVEIVTDRRRSSGRL